MKVIIDEDLCTGCGLCADICPEVFELDTATNLAKVKMNPVPEDLADKVKESAESCPVEAIKTDT